MSFSVKQTQVNKNWTQLLLEESEGSLRARNATRERTFRRMYMSVFVLFGALILVYCSLFYMGAFVDVGKVIGYSHLKRAASAKSKVQETLPSKPRTSLEKITALSTLDRVYMRKGQTILASYALPQGAAMTLTIKQCANRPVLEIFSCKVIGTRDVHIKSKMSGTLKFQMETPGFYHFESKITKMKMPVPVKGEDYHIIWLRG